MITPESQRRETLEAAGVPAAFLDAIDSPPHDGLEYILLYPEACYDYMDTIESYSIFSGYKVTPIYDGANGDTFWVLLSNDEERRFVHFELEQDEIYDDYGDNVSLLLADFAIFFYEMADTIEPDELITILKSIGFEQAEALIRAIVDADSRGLRSSFEDDNAWRSANVPRLLESGG